MNSAITVALITPTLAGGGEVGLRHAFDILAPMALGDHTGRGFTGVTTMLFIGVPLFAKSWFLLQRVCRHLAQLPVAVAVA